MWLSSPSSGVLVVVLAVGAACCSGFRLALVADIHYDAEYGTPGAFVGLPKAPCKRADAPRISIGCESSPELITSWISDLDSLSLRADVVLFAGDFLRHGLRSNASVTGDTVVHLMAAALAQHPRVPTPCLLSLGNHDLSFDTLASRLQRRSLPPDWRSVFFADNKTSGAFFQRGYDASRITDVNLTIVSVNTNLWTLKPFSSCRDEEDEGPFRMDPRGKVQLAWMRELLSRVEAEGGQAIVVGHVPPTGYRIMWGRRWQLTGPQYFAEYEAQYAALLQRFANVVVAQLFAHQHVGHISAATDTGGVPLIITGSISPVFGLNPVYTVLDYDPSMRRLTRVAVRRLPLKPLPEDGIGANATVPKDWEWGVSIPQDLSSSVQQSSTAIDHVFLMDVARRFVANASLAKVLTSFTTGSTVSPAPEDSCDDTSCWALRRCTFIYATAPGVQQCMSNFRALSSDDLVIRFFFLFAVTILGATALTCFARRSNAEDEAILDGLNRRKVESAHRKTFEDEPTPPGADPPVVVEPSWAPPSLFA